jgi:hypothetical protein
MKIIKEGVKPETVERCKNCKNCGCRFTYAHKDIQRDWRDGDYVICPTCGKFIAVK